MKVKLSEISICKGMYGISASTAPKNENKPNYIRITDILDDGTLSKKNLKSFKGENYGKYLLQKNDIVFARTGNTVGKSYFYNENDGPLVFAGFLIKFSLNPKKVYPLFIKYYVQTNYFKKIIKNVASDGSTRPNINAKQFGNLTLNLPSIKDQKNIADKLFLLDKKISLIKQINDNLAA